ncbi:MAG: transcriptional repressor MprA [Verrucomicrobia bacterium ADurb.Bin345]|nr:MAG: transcriptional repressor MprA [Verrucomicrobia bacterium ADurb.Bin345]
MNSMTLNQFADRMLVILPELMQELWLRERGLVSNLDISLPQLHTMMYLNRKGSCPMRELARALRTRESSVTGLVDRMTRQGLLKRVRSRVDRRVVHVAPTTKGRHFMRRLERHRRHAIMLLFSPLKPADRLRHVLTMEKLVATLSRERKG